jgi:hypothetical protein
MRCQETANQPLASAQTNSQDTIRPCTGPSLRQRRMAAATHGQDSHQPATAGSSRVHDTSKEQVCACQPMPSSTATVAINPVNAPLHQTPVRESTTGTLFPVIASHSTAQHCLPCFPPTRVNTHPTTLPPPTKPQHQQQCTTTPANPTDCATGCRCHQTGDSKWG